MSESQEKPALVLIDNDPLIRTIWQYAAQKNGLAILICGSSRSFFEKAPALSRSTPIFIDSDLAEEQPGEITACAIFDLGFQQIYLATGKDPSDFHAMPWIRGIIGKEPDFSILSLSSVFEMVAPERIELSHP